MRRPRRRLWASVVLLLLAGLLTTFVVATLTALLVDVRLGPVTQADGSDGKTRWTVTRWDRAGAALVHSTRTRGADWGPEQATGAPDSGYGDRTTAWASQSADGGTEWVLLTFRHPVRAGELHVYENDSPGALFRVTGLHDDGHEVEAWAGTDPSAPQSAAGTKPTTMTTAPAPGGATSTVASTTGVPVSKIPLAFQKPVRQFRIYLASDKVPGWNEVDAVGLVDDAGVTQWAEHVEASSTYASASRGRSVGASNPAALVPAWSTVGEAPAGFNASAKNVHQRLADARGWPFLALYSETDPTTPAAFGPAPGVTSIILSPGISGSLAVTTPAAPGIRPTFPTHPIWAGILGDTLFFAAVWLVLWAAFTVPRRFVRDLARLRRGACVQCGYDLGFDFIRGCPECGWRRGEAHSS